VKMTSRGTPPPGRGRGGPPGGRGGRGGPPGGRGGPPKPISGGLSNNSSPKPTTPKPSSGGGDFMEELQRRTQGMSDSGPSTPNSSGTRTVQTKYSWSVSGPQTVQTNEKMAFKLYCKNEKNQAHSFTGEIETSLYKTNEKQATLKGTVSRTAGDGVYNISFPTPAVGKYAFNVTVTDVAGTRNLFKEHDTVKVEVLKEEPKVLQDINFTAMGKLKQGQVGRMLEFELHTKDSRGNIVNVEADDIKIYTSQGISKTTGRCRIISPGKYKAQYTPNVPGEIVLRVSYGTIDALQLPISIRQ